VGRERSTRAALHGGAARVLSWAILILGVAQLAVAPVRGSGVLAYVIGAVFVALGAARLWLAGRLRR